MPIVYRQDKCGPLSIEELDSNFRHLDERLRTLEASTILGEGVDRIEQDGDVVTIITQFGRVLGKFILPKCYPSVQGKWRSNTPYVKNDWVYLGKAMYICVNPHNSSESLEMDAHNWQVIFKN